MTYKSKILELIDALNARCGKKASLSIEHGCYFLCREDGSHFNPFSPDGGQPTKAGTGLYIYLIGLTDGFNL